MPQKIYWTQLADTRLRRLRAAGATWDVAAAALRVSRSTVTEHGRRIGAHRPPPPPPPPRPLRDPAREPLPPGHPLSWGAITAGTLLAGSRYPMPPWREREFG